MARVEPDSERVTAQVTSPGAGFSDTGHQDSGPRALHGSPSFAFSLSLPCSFPFLSHTPRPQEGKEGSLSIAFPLPISPFTIFLYHWLGVRDVCFVCLARGCIPSAYNTRSGPTKCSLNEQRQE